MAASTSDFSNFHSSTDNDKSTGINRHITNLSVSLEERCFILRINKDQRSYSPRTIERTLTHTNLPVKHTHTMHLFKAPSRCSCASSANSVPLSTNFSSSSLPACRFHCLFQDWATKSLPTLGLKLNGGNTCKVIQGHSHSDLS